MPSPKQNFTSPRGAPAGIKPAARELGNFGPPLANGLLNRVVQDHKPRRLPQWQTGEWYHRYQTGFWIVWYEITGCGDCHNCRRVTGTTVTNRV